MSMQNTLFVSYQSGSLRGEVFLRKNIKKSKKMSKKDNNSNMALQIKTKIHLLIDLIMLNNYTQCKNLTKPEGFGDIYKKLLSDPYVLYLVTTAMFFQKSPNQFYAEYLKEHSYSDSY